MTERFWKIKNTNFQKPKPCIIRNVTAKEESDVETIKELLINQITSRVRWRESVQYMLNNGVNDFVEIGPGKVLSSLVKKINKDVKSSNINMIENINKMLEKIRKYSSSDMSIFLLNERRARINEIEEKTGVRIVVVSDPSRADNRFEVSRIKEDKKSSKGTKSYKIQEEIETTSKKDPQSEIKKIEEAAVNMLPARKPKRKGDSFFGRLMGFLTSDTKEEKKPKKRNLRRDQDQTRTEKETILKQKERLNPNKIIGILKEEIRREDQIAKEWLMRVRKIA